MRVSAFTRMIVVNGSADFVVSARALDGRERICSCGLDNLWFRLVNYWSRFCSRGVNMCFVHFRNPVSLIV